MNDDADLMEDLRPTDTAFVIFSSIMGGMAGYKSFEFVRSFQNTDASLVFVRDVDQVWYQHGFRGIDGGMAGAIAYLNDLRARYPRLVFTGYSAGAFASILFGEIVAADVTVAIAPQASVDQQVMQDLRDARWKPLIEKINNQFSADYVDLRNHIIPTGNTRAVVVTPGADDLDHAHLALLKPAFATRDVPLIIFDDCSHTTMLQPLKRSRLVPELPKLLADSRSVDSACASVLEFCRDIEGISIGALADIEN